MSATLERHLASLQRKIQILQRGASRDAWQVRSTGNLDLDRLLPGEGVRSGSLVEWLGEGGAGTVSLMAAREVCRGHRPLVLIDRRHELFALPLLQDGFTARQLVVVRPKTDRDALWACEEALRCEGVGLVWANLRRLSSLHYRRLQLAAEASSGIGFIVRPSFARKEPSWAEVRLRVDPLPNPVLKAPRFRVPQFRVTIHSCHGQPESLSANIGISNRPGGSRNQDAPRGQVTKDLVPLVS